nr:hypothetical protein BaRGS_014326 [Batillaria attramentaria]
MVGKWHLGFCNLDMTPTYRGFDSFYGMYLGKGDYYDHTGFLNGYDLWDNATAEWSAAGTYSTHLFTDRVLDILQAHDPAAKPIFIYLAYQAVHGPLEVPEYYETQFCSHVSDPSRKTHCAMTAAVDEGIANITDALENLGYTDNLLTVFTTDNGGPVTLGSSNWPLRGGKSTLWEGGTRAVSFLHSDTLLNGPYTWDGLMHAVDWYPTLVRAAGDKTTISGIDGVNQWNRIKRNGNSVRSEFVYNINEVKNTSAIRVNQWKLIYNKPGEPDGWHNPPTGVTAPADPSGPYDTYMLFDIDNDPEEMYDVKSSNPTVLSDMQAKLAAYEAELVSAETGNFVEGSKPQYWGGTWSTGWC